MEDQTMISAQDYKSSILVELQTFQDNYHNFMEDQTMISAQDYILINHQFL